MKIKQNANCSIAISGFEFVKDSVLEVDEESGKYLLSMKIYSNGKITDPDGGLIPEGVLCSDFEEVKE